MSEYPLGRTSGIAADTLFHFTNSADNLVNILKHEFEPRFCLENIDLIGSIADDEESSHAIPMVCFCDLPLSRITEHLRFYGRYGIGLSKAWGKEKGISPVLYVYPGSCTSKYVSVIGKHLRNHLPKNTEDEGVQQIFMDFFELVSFVKPYEGKIYRNGQYFHKRFYDEREWRYGPYLFTHYRQAPFDMRLSRDEYMNPVKRAQCNSRVADLTRLSFEPSDIKYIFVQKEAEILAMIDAIREIKGKYDAATVSLLSSRIMSSERVEDDF